MNERLIEQLVSANCKLDSIVYQLEQTFSSIDSKIANNYDTNNDCEPIVMNCVKIMTTIKEIRSDLEIVKTEHKQLIHFQNQLNLKLNDKYQQIKQNVQQLQQSIQ